MHVNMFTVSHVPKLLQFDKRKAVTYWCQTYTHQDKGADLFA